LAHNGDEPPKDRYQVLAVTSAISCSKPISLWIRRSSVQLSSIHVNRSIICAIVCIYQLERVVETGVKQNERRLEVTDSSLLGCNIVSTGKRRLAGD